MKLIPSYELLQILPDDEGGFTPHTTYGNALRHKHRTNDEASMHAEIEDEYGSLDLGEYEGCGGKKNIDKLPDPFKMVEKELKPFADSITELVSSDQPILSMAAKHFFEKRHGKRFRPTIVQLVAKAVAAAVPEGRYQAAGPTDTSTTETTESSSSAVGGASGWEWSGASDIEIEGGLVTPANHQGSEVWR